MSATIEVKYFNSFLLRKTVDASDSDNPAYKPTSTSPAKNWIIEESRIKGRFNGTSVGFGPRAYLVSETNTGSIRFNSLIYSGVFNSRTGVNETNVFPVGEEITRSLDPQNGSIQRLYAENTDLTIFQEDKVSRALIDKDAIFSAEGSAITTSGSLVIGQIVPYLGRYGISEDPGSFAVYGYRKYFTDRKRNAVLRLSNDGITEISSYGMHDFFRDELNNLDGGTGQIGAIKGAWDIHSKSYVISFQPYSNIPIGAVGTITEGIVGANYTIANNVVTTGGGGTGLTVNITSVDGSGGITGIEIAKMGEGYTDENANAITITGGNGNARATITLVDSNTNFKTLAFDERPKGWISFYSYKPSQIFSLKNNFYSTNGNKIFQHYIGNYNEFYGVAQAATVTLIFNPKVSMSKNFSTINYEGTNGWKVNSIVSDATEFDTVSGIPTQFNDSALPIASYEEGQYVIDGSTLVTPASANWDSLTMSSGYFIQRYGFDRKENKYMSAIRNNSQPQPQEIIYGESVSGIKGYFATVQLSTDSTTDPNGKKELFAVSSNYVESSY